MLMPVVLAMVGWFADRGPAAGSAGLDGGGAGGHGAAALGMILLGQLRRYQSGDVHRRRFIVGLGLSALLGAPVRYIMLNEAPAADRAAAQGADHALYQHRPADQRRRRWAQWRPRRAAVVSGYEAAFLVIGG